MFRHPRAEEKIGPGVAYITIRAVPPWRRNRAFYVVRVDGKGDWFSFEKCLRPLPHSERFRRACRTTASQQIIDFVNRCFDKQATWICPLSGERVTRDYYNVDHEPPFEDLVRKFIAENGIDILAVEIGGNEYGETSDYFRDKTLSARFAEFHKSHARLRLTAPPGNLHRKRGPRPGPK